MGGCCSKGDTGGVSSPATGTAACTTGHSSGVTQQPQQPQPPGPPPPQQPQQPHPQPPHPQPQLQPQPQQQQPPFAVPQPGKVGGDAQQQGAPGGRGGVKRSSKYGTNKTFRAGTRTFKLHMQAKATLGSGNALKEAVALPEGLDLREWLAVNTVEFFNIIGMLYGSITEFCTDRTCPVMSAGPKFEYLWADGEKYPKPVQVSAPEYMNLLMDWVAFQVDDESLFPQDYEDPDAAYPKDFVAVVQRILKRLFRVYGHMYYTHFNNIQTLGLESSLNTSFKHFIWFVTHFKLIDQRELAPLRDLISNFM